MKKSAVRGTVFFLLLVALGSPLAADPASEKSSAIGVVPVGTDGKPLNLGFETGTLKDWTPTGKAFDRQPIKGDAVAARRKDMKSQHAGEFWIGGFEVAGDRPQGTLTSVPFKVTHPFASFLAAGGPHRETRVELVRRESGEVIFRQWGDETENLKRVVVDLEKHQGQEIFIRLVDEHTGHWGHLNFDDFRFHESKPAFEATLAAAPATDEYPFAGLTPEEAAARMLVPEGFSVTLFAGEPDVHQPVAMALDDRGRLWIAEAHTYPIRAPEGEGKDRILVFEDSDGDGRFDKRKVFIEKLNLVSGLEVGFGGVWVGAAPYLLFIPDKNSDDVPDGEPQVLLDGWAYQDTHETLNTFIWGPDGWLYGCHGVFTHSAVGKPGAPAAQRKRINAGIWRYHPTNHVFEVFAEGTSNPWGVDFDDYGQAFCTACVIPHLYHVIQGARYQRQAGNHFNPYTYHDIQTIAVHRHWVGDNPHAGNNKSDAAGGGHAHAGAMVYLGGSWPEKYRNQIFMNNIHGQRINQDQLTAKGSGYEGNRAPDFCMTQDRWSQILNLRYGPDGQVYMIDWYDANACHHGNPDGHDRSNGRIFKVSYSNAKPSQVDLQKLSDEQLVSLQLESNDWYVRHARRVLHERGANPKVHAALAKIALEHPNDTRRLRGLWALHVTNGLTAELAAKTLNDTSEYVRGWTIQLLLENPEQRPPASILQKFVELAQSDSSPVVRLYLASGLQRMPLEQRWQVLSALVAHAEDADDHNLPLMYWYAAEPLAEHEPSRALALAADSRVPLLLPFMVRRIMATGKADAIALIIDMLGSSADAEKQLAVLKALNESFKGRRQVAMPKQWPTVSSRLLQSPSEAVRSESNALALTFGDPKALASLRGVVVDRNADGDMRRKALESLVHFRDPELAPTLQNLLDDSELRSAALRGLGAYDHPETPQTILKVYSGLNLAEKRDALNTLSSRVSYATALLDAVGSKQIPAGDLSADLIRQLRNHKNEKIDARIGEVWGTARETAADKAKLIARYTKLLSSPAKHPIDPTVGRAVFAKTCQQCHTLFGTGGKVGPELTGSNRANLEYVLSNVLDPSAVMAKEYQPSVIVTADGRVITGIVRKEDTDALTVQTANEVVVLPRDEIDELQPSTQSMMPDDLLKPLSDDEVRALVAYLASPSQTLLAATPDNVKSFFNGQDLTGWQGKPELWTVENGEIVGRTTGLAQNEFLTSELLVGDFRLVLQVKLVNNEGNSGIQFRSEATPEGSVKGYQADIGADWWGKLYEEHGRELLWKESGESHVKPGEWNTYEIMAVGNHIQTKINGHLCVDLNDPDGAKRGIFALQLHSGGPTEIRFKDIQLELIPGTAAAAGK